MQSTINLFQYLETAGAAGGDARTKLEEAGGREDIEFSASEIVT